MSDKLFINVIVLKGLINFAGLAVVGTVTGINTFNAVNQQNIINKQDSKIKTLETKESGTDSSAEGKII